MVQPFPNDEAARLHSLLDYHILDTAKDPQLDELTKFTANLFGVPIALITILDQNRQWFKANVGLSVQETQRSISFCQYTIMNTEVFEVPDTHADERFEDNPLVTSEPLIRYYCGAPLINEAGFRIGSLAIIDIVPRRLTETKKRELQLLAQQVINFFELNQQKKLLEREKESLERKVKLRTEQLEKLNASKDRFFSIIAHDLLSPVNGVIGSANQLAYHIDTLSQEEIEKFAQGIFISSNRLKRLLTNLLEWASTQTGDMIFNPQTVDLGQVIKEAVDLLKETAQSKEVGIINSIKDTFFLEADENMLHSIVRNLLANAIKFSKKGGTIQLFVEASDTHLTFSIQDTGVGMSKDILEKLFRLDVKHSSLGTNEEKGTGLGLLLCKEFVTMHGGSIEVQSEEKKGSTFSVYLPKKLSAKQLPATQVQEARSSR
ncbi:GAF domain-containing sensor histidine kinase [Rhodocytophaga aerolata]|uniref:histidine kinase n=1 Tax=Rhodocytophaga aerolata TaxID=455078 RepID=A0ABT8RCI5_9BACT|nr:GAF domain-containing sensor histidine kinase [Rhodocytophaga aerolata]MDO1449034.1 GAF domain-containing sensor histidine kinase [Rhodocytophaga aerolata]